MTIPRTSSAQFNDPGALDATGSEQAGDGVYFASHASGANSGPAPRHCGIMVDGKTYVDYFSHGQPAKYNQLGSRSDYMGARRWLKVEAGSVTGTGGTTDLATKAEKAPVRKLVNLYRKLAKRISIPKLKVGISKEGGILSGLLDDATTQEQLDAVITKIDAWKEKLAKALALTSAKKSLQTTADWFAHHIGRLALPGMEEEFRKRVEKIRKHIRNIASTADADRVKSELEKFTQSWTDALEMKKTDREAEDGLPVCDRDAEGPRVVVRGHDP